MPRVTPDARGSQRPRGSAQVGEDPLDVLVLLQRVDQLQHLVRLLLGEHHRRQRDVLGLHRERRESAGLDGRLELPEVAEGAADDQDRLALLPRPLAELLQSVIDELQLQGLRVQSLRARA